MNHYSYPTYVNPVISDSAVMLPVNRFLLTFKYLPWPVPTFTITSTKRTQQRTGQLRLLSRVKTATVARTSLPTDPTGSPIHR